MFTLPTTPHCERPRPRAEHPALFSPDIDHQRLLDNTYSINGLYCSPQHRIRHRSFRALAVASLSPRGSGLLQGCEEILAWLQQLFREQTPLGVPRILGKQTNMRQCWADMLGVPVAAVKFLATRAVSRNPASAAFDDYIKYQTDGTGLQEYSTQPRMFGVRSLKA